MTFRDIKEKVICQMDRDKYGQLLQRRRKGEKRTLGVFTMKENGGPSILSTKENRLHQKSLGSCQIKKRSRTRWQWGYICTSY